MKAQRALKLTRTQLRQLSIDVRPAHDEQGNVVLVDNPGRKPYRFSDGNKGAPIGFRIYVGPRKAFYEIRVKKNGITRYIALPGVQEIDLADAHQLANDKRKFVVETGKDPELELRKRAVMQEGEKKTLGQVLDDYVAELQERVKRGKYKASSLGATKDALARFNREKMSLRGVRILDLTEDVVKAEFYEIRNQSMWQSKRLPLEVKELLARQKEWWHLSKEDLVALGLEGRMIELAHSAGLAAAERAMMTARTAVGMFIKSDHQRAAKDRVQPLFYINPFDFLAEKEYFRTKKELQQHYFDAEVRNPLSLDSGSVQAFMKALLVRRTWREDRQVASDYLFLTMLWGSRRNESAIARWWDSMSKDEIRQNLASWVWIAEDESQVNTQTKCRGSQVFFHDTKNGQHLLLPIAPFAKQLLTWRLQDRDRFREETKRFMQHTADPERMEDYKKLLRFNERWVFPARKAQAKLGHYTVSNSIFHNLRVDAGLLDPENDRDIGLAAHDLRRTLGRFAGQVLPGHFVSQLLNHKLDDDKGQMSYMSERYSQQEWPTLIEAMAKVEASIISTSPRVWNALKSPEMPAMDETNDPPLKLTLYNRPHGYDTQAHTRRRRSFPERDKGSKQAQGAGAG